MNVVLEASIVRRQRVARVVIVIGLLIAACALRLQQLVQLPPGVFVDEGANGLDALKVLQGHHALFFPENLGREGPIMYADALAIALLGRTVLAVRLPAALASLGRVLAFFGWGRFCSLNGAAETQSQLGAACLRAPLPLERDHTMFVHVVDPVGWVAGGGGIRYQRQVKHLPAAESRDR